MLLIELYFNYSDYTRNSVKEDESDIVLKKVRFLLFKAEKICFIQLNSFSDEYDLIFYKMLKFCFLQRNSVSV